MTQKKTQPETAPVSQNDEIQGQAYREAYETEYDRLRITPEGRAEVDAAVSEILHPKESAKSPAVRDALDDLVQDALLRYSMAASANRDANETPPMKDGAKVGGYISNCGSHGDHIHVQSLIEGRWLSLETWQREAQEKFGINETYFAEIRRDLNRQGVIWIEDGLVSAEVRRWPMPDWIEGMYDVEEVLGVRERGRFIDADTSRPVIIEEKPAA
jgi:hypothetical protein